MHRKFGFENASFVSVLVSHWKLGFDFCFLIIVSGANQSHSHVASSSANSQKVKLSVLSRMFTQTRSSLLKGDPQKSFEAQVFKSRRNNKRKETVKESAQRSVEVMKREGKLDMKKLRYEVIKFGTTGLQGSEKEESRVALAVALGAKPQKKKYRNYTEILAEKKARTDSKNKVSGQNLIKRVSAKRSINRKRSKDNRSRNLLKDYGKIKHE